MFGSGRAARVAVVALALLSACTRDPDRRIAPNLLSPAPDTTSGGECVFGMIRADLVRGREALEALGPYAPSWLPPGFGLAVAWRPPGDTTSFGDGAGAIWTDASCRSPPDRARRRVTRPRGVRGPPGPAQPAGTSTASTTSSGASASSASWASSSSSPGDGPAR